jgi:aryl-alcohol dehydrogenase-like predicted oxidoreductase
MEQPQYNLLFRDRVEKEYGRLYDDIGLGLTTWSPLASGVLSGKYAAGRPAGSRLTLPGYEWLSDSFPESVLKAAGALVPIAADLGASASQLALAWCLRNPRVSTVITGASRLEQLRENLDALDLVPKISADVAARIELALAPALAAMRG